MTSGYGIINLSLRFCSRSSDPPGPITPIDISLPTLSPCRLCCRAALKAEMKVQAFQTAVTALIGVGLIRIAPAVLQGLGMASE